MLELLTRLGQEARALHGVVSGALLEVVELFGRGGRLRRWAVSWVASRTEAAGSGSPGGPCLIHQAGSWEYRRIFEALLKRLSKAAEIRSMRPLATRSWA